MKILGFHQKAFAEYIEWSDVDKTKFRKINELLKDILRHPFLGNGKPEPLKYQNDKFWSRRITEKDRLVYSVLDDMIIIISCKGHYV